MKKTTRIAALFMALALAAANVAFAKDRLAILPFTGGQGEDGETIAELLSFEKDLTAVFTPVPRTSINSAIRGEQGFQMGSGMTDPDTTAALGKQLGAQYVVAGSITALGTQKLLIIAIIKIDELRQVAGDIQTYGTIGEIRGKLPAMAKNIVDASGKDASKLPLLAVPPVRLAGGANTRDADTLAQLLAVHLVRSGKYAVYPRTKSLDQVQTEYGNQFGGDVADEYLPSAGMGNNPRLVLSVTARKLDRDTMFNAAVINLESGDQEAGDYVDYRTLEDGVRVMEELALKLSGEGERAARIKAEAAAARNTFAVGDAAAFARAVAAINNDEAGGSYTITLGGSFAAASVIFIGNAGKTIILKGDGTQRTITNNGTGLLINVLEGVTLTLESGVILDGGGKEASVVRVNGGTFIMKTGSTVRGAKGGTMLTINGSKRGFGGGVYVWSGVFTMQGGTITGNSVGSSSSYGNGGGVYVASGVFTMQGGTITGNSVSGEFGSGGGVYVSGSGAFTMEGGEISRNTVASSNGGGGGGGVFVAGTFTMEGGEISRNTATSSSGGGVYVAGVFMMEGGTITGNSASGEFGSGGGVYVAGVFTMEGGTVTGNSASGRTGGGGVYVVSGTFTMEGGEISRNTATSSSGGGVWVASSAFTMQGGTISGNSASDEGGGVWVYSGGTFTMEGGTITGNSASGNGGGVWVYSEGTFIKRGRSVIDGSNSAPNGKVAYAGRGKQRNSAAGQGVNMDSRLSGSAGGWE